MLLSLQICVGKEFMRAIPLFHALILALVSLELAVNMSLAAMQTKLAPAT